MCYNNCKIEIKSLIDGSYSVIKTSGKVTKTQERTCYEYDLDGDKCFLTVNGGEAVQERCGEQNIKIIFRKGKKSECFFENGDFSGSLPVFTHDFRFLQSRTADGVNCVDTISIFYTLGEQKIELEFSAEYNKKVEK